MKRKWIAGEILKQEGKSIKDLADILEPEGLSYRTVYAYFARGGGSLEIGAKIAKAMGKALDDIYVDESEWQGSNKQIVRDDKQDALSLQNEIAEMPLTAQTKARGNHMNNELETLSELTESFIDDPTISEDVKEKLLEVIDEKNRQPFMSSDFNIRSVAFLTATPDDFAGIAKAQFPSFCEDCRKHNATRVVENVAARCTDSSFYIDSNTLSFIGIHFGKCGFDKEAIRCFEQAKEVLAD